MTSMVGIDSDERTLAEQLQAALALRARGGSGDLASERRRDLQRG
jgi:hypothetical protein